MTRKIKKEPVKMLQEVDTEMIHIKGWIADKEFKDNINNSHLTYQKVYDYAKKLSLECKVAIRSVADGDTHIMKVYKK